MNIDLRNVDHRTEAQIKAIKQARDIATNTEAAKYAIKSYMPCLNSEKHWKARAMAAEDELKALKNAYRSFVGLLDKL